MRTPKTPPQLFMYDCTLREGAQGAGASFTVDAKLRVARFLDDLGIPYIEAGNPGSNPKDVEFYRRLAQNPLKNAKLVAFGSTCRVGLSPEKDSNLQALLAARTPAVCIFGKCWTLHVEKILKASLEANLQIIRDSVSFLVREGLEVIFDAEHFFSGFEDNTAYALAALEAALEGGASWLTLCDTNGGCFPSDIQEATHRVVQAFGDRVGIHCHNDVGMAEANTLSAVQAGARLVQVTANGWGERCGNADLCTTLPNLQLKLGYACVPAEKLNHLTGFSKALCELANVRSNPRAPYVGASAFTHKAGMHIDAVRKTPVSFEHIAPEIIGNERRFALSEMAGRMAVVERAARVDPTLTKDSPQTQTILDTLKAMELEGYQFEGADASFELMVRRVLGLYKPHFELKGFKVIVVEPAETPDIATAMIEVHVDGEREITAATGNGPVNALDAAARKALERFYPQLRHIALRDYQVRVLGPNHTASTVRVLIETGDGEQTWTTVGVSADIIDASWKALVDALEYKLLLDEKKKALENE